ncbi:hypothetical protein QN277_004736 [Acacia crassicarpa]|uniref:Gnk2-homologous domain-containing protein n=1 Tax=Acacia crassicarpa TaxID=499986 RepID=A0AAE1J2I4_9FABA|nr:hypothetical protein QN277_004736 [Acacia crassicarpa]
MSIFSFPLLLLTSFITPSSSATEAAYIYSRCSQAKFTQGSAYESGVNSLLTSIVNAAMFCSYNNLTVLASSSSSSSSQDIPIYGLFQCRGDLATADCSHCVAQAVSQLGTICPDFTGGALQLDGCFVRYDDSEFLGGEDNSLVLKKCGLPDGFNFDVLTQRDAVLEYLETSDGLYKMFRTTGSGNLQGMAQCVGDLSAIECQDCLSNAIGRLRVECGPVQWGQIYLAKCYARYSEDGYDSPDENGKHKNKKKKKKKKLLKKIAKIVGPTAATVAGGGATALLTIYITKKFQKRKGETPGVTPTSDGVKVIVRDPIVVRVVSDGSPGDQDGGGSYIKTQNKTGGGGSSSGPNKGGNGDRDDVPDFPVHWDYFRFPWDCPFPCDWHCSQFH